jgi:hypothetical protein
MYERRKPAKTVLRGEEGIGRTMEGVNLTQMYCKNICKYHTMYAPVQQLYAKKIILEILVSFLSLRFNRMQEGSHLGLDLWVHLSLQI